MKNRLLALFTVTAAVWLGLTAWPATASAHEKWFVDKPNNYPVDFSLLFSWQMLAALLVGGMAVAVGLVVDQQYQKRVQKTHPKLKNNLVGISEEKLQKLYAYLPMLLAFHVAVPLLVNGFQLQLFAPNLKMEQNLLSGVLALAEFLIALALVYGVFTDLAALGLLGLVVVGLLVGPLVGLQSLFLLEHIYLVGIALFLYVFGRGPISADALLGRQVQPHPRLIQYALPVLRWTTGLSLIILAFTEKLLNPPLAEAFLTQKIDFNLGGGLGLTDVYFTYIAGIIEFIFGVLLILGVLPRLVIIAAWVPFNLTVPYLGWIELAGHLPIYGIMLLLLILGPGNKLAAQRSVFTLAEQTGVLKSASNIAFSSPNNTIVS